MRRLVVTAASLLAACSSSRPSPTDDLSCGPDTEQIDNVCLPIIADAGHHDAPHADAAIPDSRPDAFIPDAPPDAFIPDAPPDAFIPDAPPDAAPDAPWPDAAIQIDEATAFAIDPAHDNAQPADTIHSPLTARWTASFSGHVSYPLVVGGIVVVSAGGTPPTVRALDISTGAVVWGPYATAGLMLLAYDEGRIFALDFQGHLTAWDLVTGHHLWTIQILGEAFFDSPPVAIGGRVYVNGRGGGGETFAFDEQTGAMLWWESTTDGSAGCVAVSAGVVYESEACLLIAWDALTGARQWLYASACSGGGGAAPSVYNGMIWQRDTASQNKIVDKDGNLLGTFNATAVPAFHAGTAFYQAGGTVSAVDIASNAARWSFTGDGQLCTAAVVAGAGGQVFVASSLGHVYELDEATGAQRSVDNLATPPTCWSESDAITVAEGHLLVPAGNSLVVY